MVRYSYPKRELKDGFGFSFTEKEFYVLGIWGEFYIYINESGVYMSHKSEFEVIENNAIPFDEVHDIEEGEITWGEIEERLLKHYSKDVVMRQVNEKKIRCSKEIAKTDVIYFYLKDGWMYDYYTSNSFNKKALEFCFNQLLVENIKAGYIKGKPQPDGSYIYINDYLLIDLVYKISAEKTIEIISCSVNISVKYNLYYRKYDLKTYGAGDKIPPYAKHLTPSYYLNGLYIIKFNYDMINLELTFTSKRRYGGENYEYTDYKFTNVTNFMLIENGLCEQREKDYNKRKQNMISTYKDFSDYEKKRNLNMSKILGEDSKIIYTDELYGVNYYPNKKENQLKVTYTFADIERVIKPATSFRLKFEYNVADLELNFDADELYVNGRLIKYIDENDPKQFWKDGKREWY